MRIEEHVEIGRSRGEVWDFVVDPLNDPQWCSKVKTVETVEHVVVEPPERLGMREQDRAGVFNVEYRLDATDSGTRLTQVSDRDWKRLPRVLRPAYDRGTRRDVRAQLRALKAILERA